MRELWRSAVFRIRGHSATLQLVFQEPPPVVHWQRVEGLLAACGVKVWRGQCDGTRLELNGNRTELLQTPEGEASRPVVRKTRAFLEKSGITPAKIRHFLGAMP